MSSILILGGSIITMDAARRVIENGFVAIRDERIVAVGEASEAPESAGFETVIDGGRKAVLPGLIDCHAHAGHGLVKTLGADDGDAWYQACERIYRHASSPEFWAAEAALASLERLRFGVTCGVSLLGGGDSILRTDATDYGDRHMQAVQGTGVREVLAVGPGRPPFPSHFSRWNGPHQEAVQVSFDDQLNTSKALIEHWHGASGGRLNVCVVSPTLRAEHLQDAAPETLSALEDQARAARALSREHGVLFTQDGHTRGSVRTAHRLGLLGPDALLSHATDLDDDEIALCAETSTRISHNPSAIASVYGRCPVIELLDVGVTVGLGSDATAPDRSGDMLRHVQQCMHYHRRHFLDAKVLPPGKALEMATIDGAHALGMEDDIGSLEAGKKADVILIDLWRPHLVPLDMTVHRVAYFANGNDVVTTIVDGQVLMLDGAVQSVDTDTVLENADREANIAVERAGLGHLRDAPATLFGHSHY